ncbi:MAG: sialate O-acetylesterase [Planctomycetia bacterium]|nr:sialate O-acetylesterase [Planctomycetia bacterium]
MKRTIVFLAALASLCFFGAESYGDVRLPNTFSDNAVLQRDLPVNVWGWCDPGEVVSVSFNGQTVKSCGCQKGKWTVQLPASPACSEGKELIVKGKNEIRLQNVVVGEVWVCGGQSNMEQPLNSWGQPRNACSDEEISGDYSFIRFNRASRLLSPEPLDDLQTSGWTLCKDGAQKSCTAAGFHFAVRLHKELNVPIGLIDSNWGGSRIDWWIPDAGWKEIPELASILPALEKARNLYLKSEGYKKPTKGIARDVYKKVSPDLIGSMYNAMMAPWIKYTIRGAIWYQGESNAGEKEAYYYKQKALIQEWRKVWKQGDFPFIWVQLANFTAPKDNPADTGNWPGLRDGQTKSLDIPNTGQAVIIDIGEEKDIHPRNKFDVGNRLALWALAKTYGIKVNYQSPTYQNIKIEGNKAVLTFDHVGEGLIVGKKEGREPVAVDKEGKLARFAVAGADQKWVWADAKIVGKNTIVVSSDQVPAPVAVRYAWQMNPSGCNLYSADGLPATPFRTDQW